MQRLYKAAVGHGHGSIEAADDHKGAADGDATALHYMAAPQHIFTTIISVQSTAGFDGGIQDCATADDRLLSTSTDGHVLRRTFDVLIGLLARDSAPRGYAQPRDILSSPRQDGGIFRST